MKLLLVLTWILEASLILALPFKKQHDLRALKRTVRSSEGRIECRHMESMPGDLWYKSPGSEEVCGLYLIGQPEEIVEIQFSHFDISCETGGVLAIFDGWELNGDLFPSLEDHELSMSKRYLTFCGKESPSSVFVSSQNVALIQFLIPGAGEGFRLNINFKPAPQPCNAVSMLDVGTLTMKNYGRKRNCTVSIIYPEKVQLLNVDVGVSEEGSATKEAETGLTDKCIGARGDYVQLMDGNGLETSLMHTRGVFCGMDSTGKTNPKVVLGCQNSVVRMVSSGEFYNTVTFNYSPPSERDLAESGEFC